MKTIAIFGLLIVAGVFCFAGHPTSEQLAEVQRLAHELELQVSYMVQVVRGNSSSTQSEQIAILNLEEFYRDVAQFHENVESCTQPSHTENDYRQMCGSYCRATERMGAFHDYENVASYRREIDRLMQQLTWYYENRSESSGGAKIEQIRPLAHQIEDIANRLYRTAATYGTNHYAMNKLSQLVCDAAGFHTLVENSYCAQADFYNSYQRLVRTYKSLRHDITSFDAQSCADYGYIGQLLSLIRTIYENNYSEGQHQHHEHY